jgi:hypothetical protein
MLGHGRGKEKGKSVHLFPVGGLFAGGGNQKASEL